MADRSVSPKNKETSEVIDDEIMYVISRTGRKEELDTNQITKRLQTLINRRPKIHHVNPYELMLEVCKGLKSGIKTTEIDEYAANASASLSIGNPHYLKIAARIAIDNHQKNTSRSFTDKMRMLYLNRDQSGQINSLVNEQFFKYVEEHQDFIESAIDYNRDFLLDFFGFRTFQRNYAMKIIENPAAQLLNNLLYTAGSLHSSSPNSLSPSPPPTLNLNLNLSEAKFILVERPQDMFMRTAIVIHMGTGSNPDDELIAIKNTYDALSQKKYTHASPTYYNAGGHRPQYASCFLLGTEDSRAGIMKTANDISEISKWSGGIGIHCNNWRGTGALIRGTNGRSSGIIPWLKIYNEVMKGFNQGGRRPGSCAIYLMPHHPNIMKFIEMGRNGGNDEFRARDLFYALWIPDIFMERVKAGGIWSMFDPDRCGDLSNLHGAAYRAEYLRLEEAKMYSSQMPARKIWEAAYETNIDVGRLYMCFSDTANRLNMQANLGTLKSSNLCVSGETLILTQNGYFDIKTLAETNGGRHIIWNGFVMTKAQFAKTGENKSLLKITFSDGVELKCTPKHKFALFHSYRQPNAYIEADAEDLVVGDKLIKHDFPVIELKDNDFKYPYTHGFFCGDGTYAHMTRVSVTCQNNALDGTEYCGRHTNGRWVPMPRRADGKCAAVCQTRKPFIDLYHEKQALLPHIEHISYVVDAETKRMRLTGHDDMPDKFVVPIDKTKDIRLKWLAGYLDADGCFAKNGDAWSLQVTSIERDFLMKVKLLCNTLGTNPMLIIGRAAGRQLLPDGQGGQKYYATKTTYRLCFSVTDSGVLYDLGLTTHRLQWNGKQCPMQSKKQHITVRSIEKLEQKEDTYCFNEPTAHMGIFNGIIAMNCAEVYLNSSSTEYAVCILSSIALPNFVLDGYSAEELAQPEESRRPLNHEFPVNPYFDFKGLLDIAKVVTTNLNHIIDKTFHPLEETRRGNDRHRPIGVGVQGLDDCYAKMRFPFASPAAAALNKKIFETIYYGSITQSSILARQKYRSLYAECKTSGSVKTEEYSADNYDVSSIVFTEPADIPKDIGAYPSMKWNGGSPIGKGVFHWELAGLKKEDLSGMWEWDSLREHIKTFGVRNSLTVAIMPTATTSQLLGNNECIEPYTSNVYKRNTTAGEYIVVKKYLMNDLYNLGIWSVDVKDYLIASGGSIKSIEGIPDELKELYPTVWEIDQMALIQQAIDRQPFVDQGQSLNLYVSGLTIGLWNKLMFKAWEGGLKTGKYYLHSKPAATPQKFTIDPKKQKEMRAILDKQQHGTAFMEPLHEVCEVCSG